MHDPLMLLWAIRRPPITPKEWRRAVRRPFRWSHLPLFVDVWHREPNGADAGRVCKNRKRRRWHVHHWHIRVWPVFNLRRWLFARCDECGRKFPYNYAPMSNGADKLWHHECASLEHLRNRLGSTEESYVRVVRRLMSNLDWTDEDLLADLYRRPAKPDGYGMMADCHLASKLLGWEFDHNIEVDGYWLKHPPTTRRFRPHDHPLKRITANDI